MKRTGISMAALLAASFAGCAEGATGPGPSTPITELPRELSLEEQALIGASHVFAVDLLTRVHEADPASTVFLSPLSASMALGMTMNGAAADTRSQMQEMLVFGGMSADEINVAYRDLVELLRGLDPRVDFRLANAIFHRNDFVMEAPFVDVVESYFDANVEGMDLDAPGAADHINAWVESATANRITDIVQAPLDPNLMALLANAIYFKGDWTGEFDPDDTYSGPFNLQGGGTQTVRFMTKDDSVGFRQTSAWKAVELPYGGGAWVMDVAIPAAGHDLDDVVADLGALLDPAATWSHSNVRLHLPRFELEWERTLNDDLKALGMVDAFSETAADFTPMNANALALGLHVGFVKQKTFLRVDEVGTEAAAVTVVGIVATSCCSGPPEFRVDQPFFVAIRERLSGTVLFAGLIVEAPTM